MEYKDKEFQDREYTFQDAIKDRAIHSIIAKIILLSTFIVCTLVIYF